MDTLLVYIQPFTFDLNRKV